MTDTITVVVGETPAGTVNLTRIPGTSRELIEFTYHRDWISNGFELSPELPLTNLTQRPTLGRPLFGAFQDAGPDRWGTRLISERARRDRIPYSALTPMRELLLVPDSTRQGALRFAVDGVFTADEDGAAPWNTIDQLHDAAITFAEEDDPRSITELLLHTGTSPGGAQPKTVIRDDHNQLWLAKFPHTHGPVDQGRWEHATMLASMDAGITVADSRSIPIDPWRAIFITRRFDRTATGQRVPYMSFRTMLQLTGAQAQPNPSYVELAHALRRWSADPHADAAELFRRAVFNAAIHNNDDHMRNFGLLRHSDGWRLSPAFDVNPAPHVTSDTPLTPGGDPRARNPFLLLEYADAFGLSHAQAHTELERALHGAHRLHTHARNEGVDTEVLERGRMRALREHIPELRCRPAGCN